MSNLKKLILVRGATGIYFLILLIFLFLIREKIYLNPGETVLPSVFFLKYFGRATEFQLNIVFSMSSIACLFFAIGFQQQLSALIMFLTLNFLIHANTLLMEIHYTYLGWMLLIFMLSPSFKLKEKNISMENLNWWADKITFAALFALGISFTYLGLVKLTYPHYFKSSLTDFLLSIPEAHPHNRGYFDFLNQFLRVHLSDNLKMILGLAGACAEFLILPLILFKNTRLLAHTLTFLVLLYIMIFVNYWHIALLMMIFQVMAFDTNLLKTKKFSEEY